MKISMTKRTLILSFLSLMICICMLIGTTFAWFTDTVISKNNIIKSGNLDLEFEYWNGQKWENVSGDTNIITNTLWEPGATEVAYLRIANVGSLALKYYLGVNILSETEGVNQFGDTFKLSDYMMFGVADGVNGETNAYASANDAIADIKDKQLISADYINVSSLTSGDKFYFALVVYMPSSVTNNANHNGVKVPSIDLGIRCLATQHDYESDSFDNKYDSTAKLPVEGNMADNGNCGDVTWILTDSNTLTVVPDDLGTWKESVIYNEKGEPVEIASPLDDPDAYKDVTSIVIKDGVTSIGSFTAKFPNLSGEVVIPASVTYIGQEAFQNAPITKLTFAHGGTEKLCIAPGAFKNIAVEEIVLPDDRPVEIHCWAFNNCKSLKRVYFPATVTALPGWTHVDYYGMDYVYRQYANACDLFSGCTALEKITFGSEQVKNMFLAGQGNQNTVNKLGVTLEVK